MNELKNIFFRISSMLAFREQAVSLLSIQPPWCLTLIIGVIYIEFAFIVQSKYK